MRSRSRSIRRKTKKQCYRNQRYRKRCKTRKYRRRINRMQRIQRGGWGGSQTEEPNAKKYTSMMFGGWGGLQMTTPN